MYLLRPALQDYPWGMTGALEEFIGEPVSGGPIAEAWWGAHASAPATATAVGDVRGDSELGLDALISRDPHAMLGPQVARDWERLPYLLKVLAIAKPLSLQVHPHMEQARAGFAAEERRGVPLDDPRRTFKDSSHKPEMIVALTPMSILVGFRRPKDVALDLAALGSETARRWAERLMNATEPTLAMRDYVTQVLHAPDTHEAVAALAHATGVRSEAVAVAREALAAFPSDPGALVALALNVVRLAPGEACFTGAGVIHSYQSGLGVEVMANSDNVVRAGLTPKPIEVDLLIDLIDGTPSVPPHVIPDVAHAVARFRAPTQEFSLSIVTAGDGDFAPGPRIVLAIDGAATVTAAATGEAVTLDRGRAVFVPFADGDCRVSTDGAAVVVEVPVPEA